MKKGSTQLMARRQAVVKAAIDFLESIPLLKGDRKIMEQVTKMLPKLAKSAADNGTAWQKKKIIEDAVALLSRVKIPLDYTDEFGLTMLKLQEAWGQT